MSRKPNLTPEEQALRDRQLALFQEMLTIVVLREVPIATRKIKVAADEHAEIRLYRVLRAHAGICLIKHLIKGQSPAIAVEDFDELRRRFAMPHTPYSYAFRDALDELERARQQAFRLARERQQGGNT